MERLHELSEYVENLKVKKTLLGGYDRTDVDKKIKKLQEMIEGCQDEQGDLQRQLDDYEFRLQTSRMLVKKMKKKISILSEEQKKQEQEKEKLKDTYKEYCSNILQQYSESLRKLSTEFTEILDNISYLQDNIIDAEKFDELETKIEEGKIEVLPEVSAEETEVLPEVSAEETEVLPKMEAENGEDADRTEAIQVKEVKEASEKVGKAERNEAVIRRPKKRRKKVVKE